MTNAAQNNAPESTEVQTAAPHALSLAALASGAAPAPVTGAKKVGAGAKAKKEVKEPKAPKAPNVDSKKHKASVIFAAGRESGKARKDIIAQFESELGMSAACSNTYYQNFKSGAWAA